MLQTGSHLKRKLSMHDTNSYVILVDFDGTCIPKLPEDGVTDVDTGAVRVLKLLKASGHKIVLWTCRNRSRNNPFNIDPRTNRFSPDTSLDKAERWFEENEIELDGVNEVPGEEDIVGYARKALGDIIIDDTALGCPLVFGDIQYYSFSKGENINISTYWVDWAKVEQLLLSLNIIKNTVYDGLIP